MTAVSRVTGISSPAATTRALVTRIGASGLAVWVVVAALAVWLSVARSGLFLSPQNISDVLLRAVVLGLVALGESYVVLAGGIDLSVGSLATLATVLAAGLINGYPIRVLPVLLLLLALGAAIGCAHGFLVTQARIAPFIVTLGSFYALQGLAFAYTQTPTGAIPTNLAGFALASVGPLPITFLIVLAIGGVMAWVLARTVFGRHVYAVGGDPDIARMAGIRTGRVVIAVYVVSGMLAALAGFTLASQSTVGTPTAGSGLELSAITAVVLGGLSLFGGRGRLIGTAGGVLLLALMQNAFTLLSISSFYQDLFRGAVIVAAVAVFTQKE